MVEFGEQLRRAREEKGMTQQSLAEQLYVTRQYQGGNVGIVTLIYLLLKKYRRFWK